MLEFKTFPVHFPFSLKTRSSSEVVRDFPGLFKYYCDVIKQRGNNEQLKQEAITQFY